MVTLLVLTCLEKSCVVVVGSPFRPSRPLPSLAKFYRDAFTCEFKVCKRLVEDCYFFLFYSDDWERRVCSIHGPSAKLQQRIVWTIVGSFGTTCTPLWGLYCTISEDIQGLVPSDIPPLNQPKDANVPKEVMKLVNFLKTQPQVIKEFKSVISRGWVCLKFRFTRTSVKNIKFSTPVSTQPSPLTT